MPPLFTIIIPTHNRPELLKCAVESVRAQHFGGWEIIIVDDCSTPPVTISTLDVGDVRIRLTRNSSNVGPGASRRVGTELANGQFLCFLDDDDYYLPEYLAEVNRYLTTSAGDFSVLVTALITETATGERRKKESYDGRGDILRQYWERPVSLLPFVISLETARRLPSPVIPSPIEDFEWICTLLSQVECRVIGTAGVVYVEHPENRTVTLTQRSNLLEREAVITRLDAQPEVARRISSGLRRDKLIHQRLHWVRQCIRRRQWREVLWGMKRASSVRSLSQVWEWLYTMVVLFRTLRQR